MAVPTGISSGISSTKTDGPVEQSFAQGRLWFLDRLYPNSTWYLVPYTLRLQGPLQLAAVNAALQALEKRHEPLRTTFKQQDGVGVQIVRPFEPKEVTVVNIPSDDKESLYNLLGQDQTTPFDLEAEAGWRVSVYRLGEEEHVLSIVMHHIVSDGWSVDVLRRELATFYSASVRGQDPLSQVEPLPIQYRDFAVWQKQHEQVDEHQRQLEYWIEQLEGSHPAEFLCDKPRPPMLTGAAAEQNVAISGQLYVDLQRYCKVHQVTPFVVLLAAFRATHYRLTGAEDATVGTPIANRNRQELEDLIGFFVNLQCIRIKIENDSFHQLVRQVQTVTAAAHANQDVPFERIIAELQLEARDASRNPVAQTVFTFHPQLNLDQFAFEDVEAKQMPFATASRFDLEFHLFQGVDDLHGSVLFATELYDPQTISSMISVFYGILNQGLRDPQTPVASLPLTDGSCKPCDMGLVGIERTEYPRESSVVDVFRRQVTASPDVLAVKDSSTEFTYTQLDETSDRLADWLIGRGLATETLVGVFGPRSCETIVAFLGILKASLAYLPLDTNVPETRTETILSSVAGHKLVLCGSGAPKPAVELPDVEIVPITDGLRESTQATRALCKPTAASREPSATSLAYVMFTSGSTGRPKGVMVEHRGIVRLVKQSNVVSYQQTAVPVAHISNIAFDASTWEIYTTLLNGGTLICVDPMTVLDSAALAGAFSQNGVRSAMLTPALLKRCLTESPTTIAGLDALFAAGDRLDVPDAMRALQLTKGCVLNAYGPTENTVLSTVYRVSPKESCVSSVPIGRAVSNSGAYVMDPQQRLVPIGVMGELVVTGDGVARGYTDPERDHDRFVRVAIDGQSEKAYRTGDYVRCRPRDGQLEFFGRMDYQVKIRGHRIELPEVERALLACECVSDAVTLVREQEGQDPELVSFVTMQDQAPVGQDGLDSRGSSGGPERQLRDILQEKLPSYMVPGMIRVLGQMPINANGKVDRQALAKSAHMSTTKKQPSDYVPPRNDVERALCEEFTNVLGTEVGISDSFFDLGGHSLMAARLASLISSRLKCRIYVFDIFKTSTPAALSETTHARITAEKSVCSSAHLEPHSRSRGRLTIVLVHGFWGQGSIYSSLVPWLDDIFDILFIHDPFFGQSRCPRTIAEWAGFYLNDVERRILPGHSLVFGGFSFGGLIAFEMASQWRSRHGNDPASLILLDAGTYTPAYASAYDKENEAEIKYALRIFGEGQKRLVLDHFDKVAPLMCSTIQSPTYHGSCLYFVSSETAATGAREWWTARCPNLQTHYLDSTHHAVLDDAMIGSVGRLINEHCRQIIGHPDSLENSTRLAV